jgi:CRP/FNR family transcriptional regulator, cyclic AMP receptor protein
MISPEILRRYGFFAGLSDAHLKEIAMISEKVVYEKGATIFEECDDADMLYILQDGNIDLFYRSEEEYHPTSSKEFLIGEINPGEIFGVSAMLDPYSLSATARTAVTSTIIKIDAKPLRKMMEGEPALGFRVMLQISKALMERLAATRVQLAAAWSD